MEIQNFTMMSLCIWYCYVYNKLSASSKRMTGYFRKCEKAESLELVETIMRERIVDQEIILIPYYPNEKVTLTWYQDLDVCKQVDNIDYVYTPELLNRMYNFLNANGFCYYIQYNGILVGDVTLRNNAEVCIVVCKEYQNKHIGRRCILNILNLASEKGMDEVKANIYSFNSQSQKMFQSIGFQQVDAEWFSYKIDK